MSDPQPQTNLYTVGGAVQAGGGLYLPRRADNELLELCRAGTFSYVLTPRQLGKTSLMVRTAERLGEEGVRSVIIDLTQIGVQVTVENWYLGLLAVIEDQLMLQTSAVEWWKARGEEGMTQRLVEFFKDVALKEVEGRLVVFVDEIDTTLSLPFTDDFYAAVRYFYNARAHTPELKRLSFVLIGVATPGDLVRDPQRTPFNIGHRVDLTDFTFDEALPLAAGLGLPSEESRRVLAWVLEWTGGHPYLTQRLCRAVAKEQRENWTREDVERLTASVFFGEMSEKDNNLQFVRDMLTKRAPDLAGVLSTYSEVLRGRRPVPDEEQSIIKSHLKLSGIVYREQGALHVRNPIYAKVFDSRWVSQHLPVNWTKRLQRIAAALALLVLLGLIPLSIYAFSQARQANKARDEAENRRVEAEKSREDVKRQADIAEARRLDAEAQRVAAIEAQKEADEQRKNAEEAAVKERVARADAEKQKRIADEQRARAEDEAKRARQLAAAATASEQEAKAARDEAVKARAEAEEARKEAERLRQLAFGGQLGALAEVTRNQQANLLLRSAVIARESIVQSPENAPPLIGYQALSQGLSLLPPLMTEFAAQGDSAKNAFVTVDKDRKYLVSVGEDRQVEGSERNYTIKVFDVDGGYKEVPSRARRAPIEGSSFSQDLSHLATVRGNTTLSVVSLASDSEAKSFNVTGGIKLAAVSNVGEKAAVVESDERTVRVWELATGREVASWKEEEGPVVELSFSPAGKYLQLRRNQGKSASGDTTWTVALRAVADGRELGQKRVSQRLSELVAMRDEYTFSRDDEYVAYQAQSDVVVRRPGDPEKAGTPLKHPGKARLIAFSPVNRHLATAGDDNILRVWINFVPGAEPAARIRHDGELTGIVFGPDENYIAASSNDRATRVWNWRSRVSDNETARVVGPDPASDVDFSPDGNLLTAASGFVRLWETRSPRDFIRQTFDFEYETEISEIADEGGETITAEIIAGRTILSPNGRYLVEAHDLIDSALFKVWDPAAPGATPLDSIGLKESPLGVSFSPDGKHLAASFRNAVRVWEVGAKRPPSEVTLDYISLKVAVSPGGKYVATIKQGQLDSIVQVWEVETNKSVVKINHERDIPLFAFSPDGQYFASGSNEVQIVRLADRQKLPPIRSEYSVRKIAFSPHGRYLAILFDELKLWVRDTGQVVPLPTRGDKLSINHPTFSDDERYLGVVRTSSMAQVWEIEAALNNQTNEAPATMFYLDSDIYDIALTRDGSHLVTVGLGNFARIWNVRDEREVARIPHNGSEVDRDTVAFTGDDDKYLVTLDNEERVQVWLWKQSDLLKASCSRLSLEKAASLPWVEYLDGQLLDKLVTKGDCQNVK